MDDITTDTALVPLLDAGGEDPLKDGGRARVRGFVKAILEEELEAALGRRKCERGEDAAKGHRNGHGARQIVGTFGPERIRVPRARVAAEEGNTKAWRSKALRRYPRLTKRAEALIASAYLAGTDMRRVKRALSALFAGAVGKDVVSRA